MPKKSASSAKSGAVLVSVNLQRFVAVAVIASALLNLLTLIPMYVTNSHGFQWQYAIGIITIIFFPVLVFASVLLLGPRGGSWLQRVFIAVIKTVAVQSVIGWLTYTKNILPTYFLSSDDKIYSSSSWLTSFALDCAFMALAVITVTAYSFIRYRRK